MTLREAEAAGLSEIEHTFREALAWQQFVKANRKRRHKD